MEDNLRRVKAVLEKYGQQHLLQFYDELTDSQKQFLIDQILSINFDEILYLYEKSKFDVTDSTEEIAPLPYINKSTLSKKEREFYSNIGIDAIKNGEIAVITLAGGQGSRLGFKGPKGTFELDTKPKISLFEVLCNYLKVASSQYNVNIPWYIMTSTENHQATINFFESKDFFGYPRSHVFFFMQENLPIIDTEGKLVLEEIYKVKVASNGNGNLFSSLEKSNLLDDMIKRNIKWIFVGGVDNVLLNPLDSLFIGLTIHSKNHIASKTLFKQDPSNINWVFALKNDKPSIVDCENFVNEVSSIQDENGNYLYRETNMLAHLFRIDALLKMKEVNLPYHRAFRKSPFVNYEGMKQVPEKPNIYKFEKFVFDAFPHFDDITLLRVNPIEEFAPIKDFNGPYNPEVAKKMYERNVLHIDSIDED